jgi:CRISPR-associated protein Cas2
VFVVVSYDIVDDRRRTRVASEMENFGERVQYSVFECHLEEAQVRELQRRVETLIAWEEDRVRYYTLCKKDQAQIVVDGPGGVTINWDYYVV